MLYVPRSENTISSVLHISPHISMLSKSHRAVLAAELMTIRGLNLAEAVRLCRVSGAYIGLALKLCQQRPDLIERLEFEPLYVVGRRAGLWPNKP